MVFCNASTIGMIGPCHSSAGRPSIALAPSTAPSWMTTSCTFTPRLRSFADSLRIRSASSRNTSPSVASARTSSGVVLTVAPITPTRMPLTRKTADVFIQSGSLPVASSTMLAERNGKSARSWWARMRSIPKSNSWLPKLVASRPHAFSTSIAGLSSSRAEFGGDAPTLSPAASSSVRPGSDESSSPNIVASCAAPPADTLSPSIGVVVGSSWPWKSFSPTIDSAL